MVFEHRKRLEGKDWKLSMQANKDLFWDNFGKWLEDHGVELIQPAPLPHQTWSAMIDINQLKIAIAELGVTDDRE